MWHTEVLSGAVLGRLFGSRGVWPFGSPCCQAKGITWETDIDAQPSREQATLGRLFRSREFWKLVPDTNHAALTAGYGSGITLATCACTSDKETCIVYDPAGNRQNPHIEMSHFSGKVRGWWFSPSTAATTDLGTFPNSGTRTFNPPDGNDWLLVLDLASAKLPTPGVGSFQ
jgi:Putative collagen-binding domain of a collagenase